MSTALASRASPNHAQAGVPRLRSPSLRRLAAEGPNVGGPGGGVTRNNSSGGGVRYGSYVDELIMTHHADGKKCYAHANHLYSVAALTDHSGSVVERYSYTAFGAQTITAPTGAVRAKSAVGFDRAFTGQIRDIETNLNYVRARMYSPSLGRFVGRDPETPYSNESIWLAGPLSGYGDGYGLYSAYFVPNSVDPLGLKICVGEARVLKGNKDLIGKPGGWSGNKEVPVTDDSAAVDPKQWGGKGALRPHLGGVSGTIKDPKGNKIGGFTGISDVIGGESPDPTKNVRDALKDRFPGKLLIELPSAAEDLGVAAIELVVPDNCPCPEGTTEKKAAAPAPAPAPAPGK